MSLKRSLCEGNVVTDRNYDLEKGNFSIICQMFMSSYWSRRTFSRMESGRHLVSEIKHREVMSIRPIYQLN